MQNLLKRLFKKKKEIKARLSKDEVLAIARDAAADYPTCESLGMVELEDRSGYLIWKVRSATIGYTLYVYVEDHSSNVVQITQIFSR